jgi:hypothetical protein
LAKIAIEIFNLFKNNDYHIFFEIILNVLVYGWRVTVTKLVVSQSPRRQKLFLFKFFFLSLSTPKLTFKDRIKRYFNLLLFYSREDEQKMWKLMNEIMFVTFSMNHLTHLNNLTLMPVSFWRLVHTTVRSNVVVNEMLSGNLLFN